MPCSDKVRRISSIPSAEDPSRPHPPIGEAALARRFAVMDGEVAMARIAPEHREEIVERRALAFHQLQKPIVMEYQEARNIARGIVCGPRSR